MAEMWAVLAIQILVIFAVIALGVYFTYRVYKRKTKSHINHGKEQQEDQAE